MVRIINVRVFTLLLMAMALACVVEAKPRPEPPVDQDALKPDITPEQEAKPQQDNKPDEESKPQQDAKQPIVDHYDQRQNGSENYRVRVDGLVFILAPADSLLLAGAALDQPNFSSFFNENKPQPKPEQDKFLNKPEKLMEKEDFSKSTQQDTVQAGHKPSLRITSLIAPFLTKFRQMQHPTK